MSGVYHGIWAFKVDAAGGRTDLVYQDKMTDLGKINPPASGLVLTEWKLCRTPSEAVAKFEEARTQAKLYAQGILAGIELVDYRYAVVVSKESIMPPDDIPDGQVVYRHVNIAVSPSTPSRLSKK